MAKHPTICAVPIDQLIKDYGAMYFHPALARFITLANEPNLTCAQLEARIRGIHMLFGSVPVWHHIKYLCKDPVSSATVTADSIHVWPATVDTYGRTVPGHFDTALVNKGTGGDTGVEGESQNSVLYTTKLTEGQLSKAIMWVEHK